MVLQCIAQLVNMTQNDWGIGEALVMRKTTSKRLPISTSCFLDSAEISNGSERISSTFPSCAPITLTRVPEVRCSSEAGPSS